MRNPFFRNVEELKITGKIFLENMGYRDLVYEGADPSLLFGGYVWFQGTHRTDAQLLYTISVRKQGSGIKCCYEYLLNESVKGFLSTNNP